MNPSDFLLFDSPDENIRRQIIEKLNTLIEDREFIDVLFQLLETTEKNLDNITFRRVNETLKIVINRKWTNEFCFWDQKKQENISDVLISLLLQTPYEARYYIIDCFQTIILCSSVEFILQIVEKLLNYINIDSPLVDDDSITKIIKYWAKKISVVPSCEDALRNKIRNFNSRFVSCIIEIFGKYISDSESIFGISILINLCKSLTFFSKRNEEVFFVNNFDMLLSRLIEYLSKATNIEKINSNLFTKLIKNSCEFFISQCKEFLTVEEAGTPRHKYSEVFKSDFLPSIYNIVFSHIESADKNSCVYGYFLYIYSQLLGVEAINKDQFSIICVDLLTNHIIPSVRLTNDEATEFEDNPEQFFSFYFSFKRDTFINHRRSATRVLMEIINHYHFDELYDLLCGSDSIKEILKSEHITIDSILEIEKYIYLMSVYINLTISERGPIIDQCDIELYVNVLNSFGNDFPLVGCSVLYFLKTVLPEFNLEMGISIALTLLSESDNRSILIQASKLLIQSIISINETPEIEYDFDDNALTGIVEKLVRLSSESDSIIFKKAIQTINTVISPNYQGNMLHVVEELLAVLQGDSSDIESIKSSISSVGSIFSTLETDQDVLIEFSGRILPKLSEFFKNSPDTEAIMEILFLYSCINTKIVVPMDIFYKSASDAISALLYSSSNLYYCEQITCAFAPLLSLISRYISYIKGIPEYIESFIGGCIELSDGMISFISENVEKTSLNSAYASVFLGCLNDFFYYSREFFHDRFIDVVDKNVNFSISILTDKDTLESTLDCTLFSSCIYALATSLLYNPEIFFQKMNTQLEDLLLSTITPERLRSYTEFKYGFIILIFLSRSDPDKFCSYALKMLETLYNLKQDPDYMKEVTEEGLFQSLVLPFQTASEDFDELGLFVDFVKGSNIMSSLEPNIVRMLDTYITSYAHL